MRKRVSTIEYERRAERLVSASAVGRTEGVANNCSIHETNSPVFGAGTRPRSMRSGTANLNDVLLNLVHQETQSNRLEEQAQPSATSARLHGDPKDSKAW